MNRKQGLMALLLLAIAFSASARGRNPTRESVVPDGTGMDLVDSDFMFIGAHPDDEAGGFGTYARYTDNGYTGVIYTITAGEGGGNATGSERYKSLGLVRLEEERQANAFVGINRLYFGGQNDFYYSLFAEEALEKWGGDDFIGDIVRVVRMTRPEIIITMWPGTGTHGHHQMAARAATLAFMRAADPEFYPKHIEEEGLMPFQPLKLYYRARQVPDEVATLMPIDDLSPKGITYANQAQLARLLYRSQGWDLWRDYPVITADPERYGLVVSAVPLPKKETDLLSGALEPITGSPVGIKLYADALKRVVGLEETFEVDVLFQNESDEFFGSLDLGLETPVGWEVEPLEEVTSFKSSIGEVNVRRFAVTVPAEDTAIGNHRIYATYGSEGFFGRNYTWITVKPKVTARFKPLFDIAGYWEFAQESMTEWLIGSLPPRVPVTIGKENIVMVEVTNNSDAEKVAEIRFEFPEGVVATAEATYAVEPFSTMEIPVTITADQTALTDGRQSEQVNGKIYAMEGGVEAYSEVTLMLLPTIAVPMAAAPPTLDGDLSDMNEYASGRFGYGDIWSGTPKEPESVAAEFWIAYDNENVYIGVAVTDDEVITDTEPQDIHAHWETDSVEITIDPSGTSSFTNTTFKVGVFPGTTAGFEARAARDADANQGIIEESAPGMIVVSQKTETGYNLEMKIPLSDIPSLPEEIGEVGFNVLVYDKDTYGATRTGWASVIGAQQATPYVWPRVTVE